jgi:hypothetical protein
MHDSNFWKNKKTVSLIGRAVRSGRTYSHILRKELLAICYR